MTRLAILVLCFLAMIAARPAYACLVCFSGIEPPYYKGLTWAILTLLAILAFIFAGVVAFVLNVRRRTKNISTANYHV